MKNPKKITVASFILKGSLIGLLAVSVLLFARAVVYSVQTAATVAERSALIANQMGLSWWTILVLGAGCLILDILSDRARGRYFSLSQDTKWREREKKNETYRYISLWGAIHVVVATIFVSASIFVVGGGGLNALVFLAAMAVTMFAQLPGAWNVNTLTGRHCGDALLSYLQQAMLIFAIFVFLIM